MHNRLSSPVEQVTFHLSDGIVPVCPSHKVDLAMHRVVMPDMSLQVGRADPLAGGWYIEIAQCLDGSHNAFTRCAERLQWKILPRFDTKPSSVGETRVVRQACALHQRIEQIQLCFHCRQVAWVWGIPIEELMKFKRHRMHIVCNYPRNQAMRLYCSQGHICIPVESECKSTTGAPTHNTSRGVNGCRGWSGRELDVDRWKDASGTVQLCRTRFDTVTVGNRRGNCRVYALAIVI